MAARPKGPAPQPIPLTPLERASLDADCLCCDLSGIRCLTAFLDDMESGSTSGQIPEATKEWLRGIIHDSIRDSAGRLEGVAKRLEKYLEAQLKAEVA